VTQQDPTAGLFDLTGRTALVTGGTRGIGLMAARGLMQAGATVYVSSRKPEAGEAAVAELAPFGTAVSLPADVSTEAECIRLAEEVAGRGNGLHILVNNAGATWGAPLEEFTEAAWDKVLDLNLKAPFFLSRACLPLLTATATADDPARIVNIGSIDGLRVTSLPTYSYSTSKAGVHQLTRVLARELGPRHVTVNAIAPGPFPSKMMAATIEAHGDEIRASSPLGRLGRDDDIAGSVVFLASRAGAYCTGVVLPVDGGIWATA
jgi:NAD(P)-dependent dehydrogenase (short-subunit alcohol dehydrogenase family)